MVSVDGIRNVKIKYSGIEKGRRGNKRMEVIKRNWKLGFGGTGSSQVDVVPDLLR